MLEPKLTTKAFEILGIEEILPLVFSNRIRELTALQPVIVTGERGNIIENTRIKSLWTAEINFSLYKCRPFRLSPSSLPMLLVITVVETEHWRRGVIVIPSCHETLEREIGGPDPPQPVDLSEWQDPFVLSLQSACILPEGAPDFDSSYDYRFRVIFANETCFGKLSLNGPIHNNQAFSDLFISLQTAVRDIVEMYDNDEMRAFIAVT